MTASSEPAESVRARPWMTDATVVVRRARLVGGIVLMVYVTCHLANHVLGLWSLEVLEAGRGVFLAVWRSLPGTVALYAALSVHVSLALWAVYRRDSFRRIRQAEAYQLLLGFATPLLLIGHVIGTRYAHETYGVVDNYTYVILVQWLFEPSYAVQQTVALLVAWTHGCLGLHLVLRFDPRYRARLAMIYAAAVLLPALSLAGYVDAGVDVLRLA
jgi:adenylate cyclase